MNLEQYNAGTNPFLAMSKMLKDKDSSGRMSLNHALIMQQVHHAGVMEQLERGHQLDEVAAKAAHRRDLAKTRITHAQGIEMENIKATHAAAQTAQQHEQAIQAATVKAGLDEAAASATHARNLELHNAITKAAQSGTEVSGKMGDTSFKFTKKAPRPRAAASVAPAAAPAPSKPGASWAQTPAGATTLPITSKPVAPSGPQPSVGRGAGGRIVSLKPGGTAKPVSKKKAKAVAGPASVGRDPKTGRAISLKKN